METFFVSIEYLRGVWGLENRDYTPDEINASEHLKAALTAGALVEKRDTVKPSPRGDNQAKRADQPRPARNDKQEV